MQGPSGTPKRPCSVCGRAGHKPGSAKCLGPDAMDTDQEDQQVPHSPSSTWLIVLGCTGPSLSVCSTIKYLLYGKNNRIIHDAFLIESEHELCSLAFGHMRIQSPCTPPQHDLVVRGLHILLGMRAIEWTQRFSLWSARCRCFTGTERATVHLGHCWGQCLFRKFIPVCNLALLHRFPFNDHVQQLLSLTLELKSAFFGHLKPWVWVASPGA